MPKVAEVTLELVAQLRDALIGGVSLFKRTIADLGKRVVDGVETLVGGLLVEPALDIADRGARGVTALTPAEAVAAATPSEQGKQDDEHPPTVTIAPSAVSIAVRHSGDVRETRK